MGRGLKEIHVDSITTEQVKKLIEVTSINFMNGLTLILLLLFLLTFNLIIIWVLVITLPHPVTDG